MINVVALHAWQAHALSVAPTTPCSGRGTCVFSHVCLHSGAELQARRHDGLPVAAMLVDASINLLTCKGNATLV
jgi:hypothetical protein